MLIGLVGSVLASGLRLSLTAELFPCWIAATCSSSLVILDVFFFLVFYFLHGFLPLNSCSPHTWAIRKVPPTKSVLTTEFLSFSCKLVPVLPQIGTHLGTWTNSSLCLLSWTDMPSTTPYKAVMPLSPATFFDSQTLLYLAICLNTWPWPFPSLTHSSMVRGLKLLLGPELLLATEPSITRRHALT